ncbi:hypothetical protein ACF0H5_008412 [Mactra antiquata]
MKGSQGDTDHPGNEVESDQTDMANSTELRMDLDSPSSELDKLHSGNTSDNESMDSGKSGKSGKYEVNGEDRVNSRGNDDMVNIEGDTSDNISFNVSGIDDSSLDTGLVDLKEPSEKRLKSDRRLTDSVLLEKRSSDGSTSRLNESFAGSRPSSVASSGKSGTPGKDKDPARKEKEREREERIRTAQQRLAEERQRKIDEMREQQRMAQENREKQLEARRKKIEELKRREEERRKQVEERRRTQEESDRVKKEAILNKAKERLTRYEQWKAHGRKGGRRHVLGFGSRTPREVCFTLDARRSSSQSTLRRSPNSSDYDSYFNRRAVSASSVVRRHCCIDINKLTQGTASAPPARHKSAVNLAGVKMRDPSKMSPRKPRPSSVATSMPSFVRVETDTPKSSRSKSTDRGPRDPSKSRVTIKTDADKVDGKERKAATLPRPYDRKKIEERRQEVKKKQEERKEREERERERMVKSDIQESKDKDKPPPRLSKSFIERMSVPKHPSADKKEPVKDPIQVKAKTSVRDKPPKVPKESPSKSALKSGADIKMKDDSSDTKSDTPISISPAPSATPPARYTPVQGEEISEVPVEKGDKPKSVSPPPDEPRETVVRIVEPEATKASSPPRSKPESKQSTPEPKPAAGMDKTSTKSYKEIKMEEYKTKLAEKRRLAREKAEREAEIERLRQEELQRQEEERQRLEEERQRQEEEEALRLAAEARKIEEERLQKAIEAEEKRKREEAERQEQERIAKEEAEKKAKEEAEKREKEMAERAKREEEERLERKKRLEMIMKRIKTDSPAGTPEKSRNESPTRVMTASSSRTSLVSSEDERTEDSDDKETLKVDSDDAPKFKSPLLQKLTEGKDSDAGTPKFKSPLLQSIMGKTKIGARLSGTKLDQMDKSTDSLSKSTDELSLSKSTDELSEKEKSHDSELDKDTSETGGLSNGVTDSVKCESTEKLIEDDSLALRTDVDAHESISGTKTVIEVEKSPDTEFKIGDSVKDVLTDSQRLVDSNIDSALSLSFSNGIGTSTHNGDHNGDIHLEQKDAIDQKDLVDSSISVRTVDSLESPQNITDTTQTLQTSDSTQFEEIIDLSNVSTKQQPFVIGETLVNHTDEALKLNNIDNGNNGIMNATGDASSTLPIGKPIIAFEENATRRQDVPDLLS